MPEETDATCATCAMCPKDDVAEAVAPALQNYFNSRTKCCTYLPLLYNFLVGRILNDSDPAAAKGRATVEQRLEARIAVTPLGLDRLPTFNLLYNNSAAAFGKSLALRCPHYLEEEGGICGIWKNRNSVCTTWFCKHVRGATGKSFWEAVNQLLNAVELGLARWCLLELEIGTEALKLLFPPPLPPDSVQSIEAYELDNHLNLARYRAIWGNWAGREREFYRECASLVSALSWKRIVTLCGPELQIYVKLVQEAYQNLLSEEVPEVLELGKVQINRRGPQTSQVTSYSPIDPLELPNILTDVLHYFNASSTAEVVETIAEQENIKLHDSIIRKLVDFKILVEPE